MRELTMEEKAQKVMEVYLEGADDMVKLVRAIWEILNQLQYDIGPGLPGPEHWVIDSKDLYDMVDCLCKLDVER